MIEPRAVLQRVSLTDLVQETVRLQKRGAQHYGLCPLHQDRDPTLRVDEKKGFWYCPACQLGGDAFDWIRRRDGLDFKQALAELAKRAGITDDGKPDPEAPALPPRRPKFPHPRREPSTPWGGQHLLSDDARPVFVMNEFPGRRRYVELAERYPGVDLIWWPAPYSRADEMFLAPIALRVVRTEPWAGLADTYRCAALVDAIAGWRRFYRGQIGTWTHDALILEAMRIEGWLEHFMQGREIAPGMGRNQVPERASVNESSDVVAA